MFKHYVQNVMNFELLRNYGENVDMSLQDKFLHYEYF